MSLNQTLINLIREAQNSHSKATAAFADTMQRYQLTAEGAEREKKNLENGIYQGIHDATARGIKAIDAVIAELDAAESSAAAARYADTDYQQRLSYKIGVILKLAKDIKEGNTPADAVRPYLAEYANDTIALNAFHGIFRAPMLEMNLLPVDNNGKRQKRLNDFKKNFTSAMESCAQLRDTQGSSAAEAVSVKAVLDNMVNYLMNQTDDFALEANEVWAKMQPNGNQDPGIDPEKGFNFKFKSVR